MLASLDGDALAYRRLLDGLRTRLSGYFAQRLRSDPAQVEDLVQETLFAIHVKRATFDRAQPVTAWVYAIARYKLIDHHRRAGGRTFGPSAHDAWAAPDEHAPADARRDVAYGLDGLSPRSRDLLVSVKLRDEPVAEVAQRTGLSQGAVKVAVHRAFLQLRGRLHSPEDGA